MSDLEDLALLVDARTPLIFVDSSDAARVEDVFARVATRCGRPLYRWSLASGLSRGDGTAVPGDRGDNQAADILAQILAQHELALFLLHDLARYLEDPLTVSQLREIGLRHTQVPHTLVLVGSALSVPAELRAVATRVEMALPTLDELKALVLEEAQAWGARQQRRVQATQAAITALTRNLLGLTHADARRLIRNAIADDGVLSDADLPAVQAAKYKLLDQGGVLSFELNTTKMADVAGLATLKRWLADRRDVFLSDTPPPGLDPPKGLLLLGVQGGGKSLAAKSVAGAWGVALLRLDFAALYNKFYGETERNLRDALKTAGVMSPCVLWIDEIEKGLASESGDDGGPGKRILGTLLTWMAERRDKVFLVATANDIAALPPELLRKGRFDEIFFVDLPKPEVRSAIFAIHLKKRGQDPAAFDLPRLAQASDGFSGAEIEQAVVSALYAAHGRSEPLSTDGIAHELSVTRPLSVVMAEKMNYLRSWAQSRSVSAD
ncbi:MAG: ATPase [Hydrocarboniphaga sp.]|uniref:AAA family ATPase n=1 Tax=Hydrocarboniphaga sp. TaxID=2033016 RepID=UPI0026073DC0|nr:AAA family ATPase [Hydrocarboniphaga sp.]MDB5973146.1 ATPase [Hydrocarboniphaga sp.]